MPRVTSNDGQFMAFIEPGLHRGEVDIRDMRFRNEAGTVWEKATEPVTVQLKEIELSDVEFSNNQQLPKGSVLFRKKFGADGERVQAQTADTGIGASVTLSYDDGTIAVDQLSGGTGYTNVEFLINGGAYDSIMEGITEEILIEYSEEEGGDEIKTLTVTLEGRGGFQDAPVVSYVKNMGEGEEVAETDKYVILPNIAADAVFSGYIVPWEGTSIIRNRNPSNLIRIGDAWAWNGTNDVAYTLYFNDDADSVKVVANSQGVVSLASDDDVLHLRVDNGTFVAATVNGVRSTTPFAGLDADNWTFRYSGGAGLQLTPTIAAGGVITEVQLDSSAAAGYASAPSVLVRSAGTLTDAFERVGEVTKDWDPALDSTLFADFIPLEEDGWTDAHRDASSGHFEVVSLGSFTEAPGGVATGIVMETLKIAHYRFAVREMKIANRAVSEGEEIHDGLVADRDAAADTPFKLKNAAGEFVSVNDAVASVAGAQSVVGGLRAVVPQGRDRVTMVGEPGVLYFVSVRRGEDPEIRAGSSRVSARSSATKDVAIRTGVSRIMTINPFVGGIREAQAQVNALRGPANTALLREVTRIVRGILTRYAQGDRLRRFLTTYPGMMMEYMYDMSSVNLYSSWDENQRGVVLKALALALADFPSLTLNDRDTELLGEDTAVLSLSGDYPAGDGVNVVSSVPVTAPGAKSDRVRFAKRNTEGYSFTSIRTVDELGTHHVQVNVDQSDAALSKEDHKLLHGMHLDFVPVHKYESEFYVRYYNSDMSRHCTVSFSGSGGDLVPIADSELDLYPM